MVSVRAYDESDLDLIIRIFLGAVYEIDTRDYSPDQIQAWGQFDRTSWKNRAQQRFVWIAEINGMAAGFLELGTNGHLNMLYVHPDFQRNGAATALIQTAEEQIRKQSLTRIFSEVSITAKQLFEKNGFTVITQQEVSVRGQRFTNFRMEKILNPDM